MQDASDESGALAHDRLGAMLVGVALVLFVVTIFVPWGSGELDLFGAAFEPSSSLYEVTFSAGGVSESSSWFASDLDENDDIGQIRFAVVTITISAVAALVAGVLLLLRAPFLGAIVAGASALAYAVGLILYARGVNGMMENLGWGWGVGLWLSVVACALVVAAAVLAMLHVRGGSAPSPGAQSAGEVAEVLDDQG